VSFEEGDGSRERGLVVRIGHPPAMAGTFEREEFRLHTDSLEGVA
jgi:hypothetical protein